MEMVEMKPSYRILSFVIASISLTGLILSLFSPALMVDAQTNCGTNRCEIYTDTQGKRCYDLDCSNKYNGQNCPADVFGCEYVPVACGPGSSIDIHVACVSDGRTARWAYYCASEERIRYRDVSGPTCAGSTAGGYCNYIDCFPPITGCPSGRTWD